MLFFAVCRRSLAAVSTVTSASPFLALDALRSALVARRPAAGLVLHPDRESHYASDDYRRELHRAGVVANMSRKGDCWHNAVSESFVVALKTEALGDYVPANHGAAVGIVREYINNYYNTQRRHSFIKYVCPIAFELKCQLAAMTA